MPKDEPVSQAECAGEWAIRFSTGSLRPSEQAAFDAWIEADPTNPEVFERAILTWRSLDAISGSPEIISQRADALDALRRANRRRWNRRAMGRWQWVAGFGLAASLVLALLSLVSFPQQKPEIYATGIGERHTIILEDGSRLSLDADSRVSVLYKDDRRALTLLGGRAKFDVAEDRTRPFTVTAGGRTTIATGTAFSVELLSSALHVILYEGHVDVVKGEPTAEKSLPPLNMGVQAIRLSPGDELVTGLGSTAAASIVRADVSESLAWEGGQMSFVDEPLSSAAEQLNRYSRGKIIVADPRAAAIRINGVFNSGDRTAFLDAITQIYPLQIRGSGKDFVVTYTDR